MPMDAAISAWLRPASYFSRKTSRTFRIDSRSDIALVYAMRLRLRAPPFPVPRVPRNQPPGGPE